MKNPHLWRPSKFTLKDGRLTASTDVNEVRLHSRLGAEIVARFYDENIRLHVRGKVLDLGCGKIPLYVQYRDFMTDSVCIDWANTFHKNPNLDIEADLNEPLSLPDGEFDTIILSDVLEHIRQPDQLWREMYRLLASGGKVLLNVPFYYWIHERPTDYFRYTEYALRSMATDAGFTVVMLEPLGGAPEIICDVVAKNVGAVPVIGEHVSLVVQTATKTFIRTRFGRKVSRRTAIDFPFGYFMVVQRG